MIIPEHMKSHRVPVMMSSAMTVFYISKDDAKCPPYSVEADS